MPVGILLIGCIFTLILLVAYIIFCNFGKIYFFCSNNKKKVLFFLLLITIGISVYFNKNDDYDDYNDDFVDDLSVPINLIKQYNSNLDENKE